MDAASVSSTNKGIFWSGMSAATNFSITSTSFSGNSSGIQFLGRGSLKLRKSSLSNNTADPQCPTCRNGIGIATIADADLGTSADPGLNVFAGNGAAGLYLSENLSFPRTISLNAVGNIWTANAQGADNLGRYSIAPNYTPVHIPAGSATGDQT